MAGSAPSTKRVVYFALAGNLLVTATKLAAAVFTGSSAMLSEAVHSFVDTGNELLLLYGMRRSTRRPDVEHPIGYGRELYFWSFIVALQVFALGAGVSIYEGILHVLHPQPIDYPLVSYLVLASGERADRRLSDSILRIAEAASPLSHANGVLTGSIVSTSGLALTCLRVNEAVKRRSGQLAWLMLFDGIRTLRPASHGPAATMRTRACHVRSSK